MNFLQRFHEASLKFEQQDNKSQAGQLIGYRVFTTTAMSTSNQHLLSLIP